MLNAHWWTKCLPQESDDAELMHGEEPPALWQIRRRQRIILKACFNSGFIIIGAILIGLSVSSLAVWPKDNEQYNRFHDLFLGSGSNSTIADHLRELTKEPHVAGTRENIATAEYVLSTFQRYGISARYSDYEVLLSYPVERNLSLVHANGSLVKSFSLQEKAAEGDPQTSSAKVIPPFHAFSPTGEAEAEVVYVNYGRREDYAVLRKMGVEVRGAIVLARYGQLFRGDIVANAERAGASAAILYSNPADYAANGKEGYYPHSRWLPPSGAQRGTVYEGIGDPLTPGWPSTKSAERIDSSDAGLPGIPSLPISAEDAMSILDSLAGPVAPEDWQADPRTREYKVGRGPGRLHFRYVANQTVATIRNVLAVIRGSEEPDRIILVGNHRDAWTFGAVDPNSGTAAMLEVAYRLGKLMKQGWKPRRTIVLCSWDAEEYGLVGSTEWVEHNVDVLGSRAVAYLNVDCAVSGPGFAAAATPQLDDLLLDVAKTVEDPDSVHATLYDAWVAGQSSSALIDRLGDTGSDYAAFLQHTGVPVVDVYFGKSYPVYHSLYDTYNWMKKFGDPSFKRHVAVASLWGSMALKLADSLVLPFNYTTYAKELESYAKAVEAAVLEAKAPQNITVEPLLGALSEFLISATDAGEESKRLVSSLSSKDSSMLLLARRAFNDKLMAVERAFLESEGLPGRSWYKHLVYGPSSRDEHNTTSFAGIMDSIAIATASRASQHWNSVQHEIYRVSRVLSRAAIVLRGELM